MKLAIMQPYFFPYIGYFQLINVVDKFVIYDDLTFIKQGWINRNKILADGNDFLFTVPLKKLSSYRLINETEISGIQHWKKKIFKTIKYSYKKAPFFEETSQIIHRVLNSEARFIGKLAFLSLKEICQYLEINTQFVESSIMYKNAGLKGQDRVIDICVREDAQHYINLIGGRRLYIKEDFKRKGIILNFIKTKEIVYQQFQNEFVPNLSMIDVMMFNPKQRIQDFLNEYELV